MESRPLHRRKRTFGQHPA